MNGWAHYNVEAHIQKICDIYRKKLNLMCDLIDSELGDFVSYNRRRAAVHLVRPAGRR